MKKVANRKSLVKKVLVLSLLFLSRAFFCGQALFADELKGAALSDSISEKLKKLGLEPQKKYLSPAWFVEFPYNVEVDFKSKDGADWSLVLAVAQEDAARHERAIRALLENFRDSYIPCDIKVAFTAGDKSKISGNESMSGTEIFCKEFEGAQNVSALVLDFDGKKNVITPGAAGSLSPYYLTRLLSDCLDNNECKHSVSGGIFLGLYRLNAFRKNARLNSFLSRSIPAVMFTFGAGDDNESSPAVNSIKDFCSLIEPEKCAVWSWHYIPIRLFSKTHWLQERTIIYSVLFFSTIALFILSDFAFLFRRRSRRLAELKLRALLSNYVTFITVAILTLSFALGQRVAQGFQAIGVSNIMVLFLIKLAPAFFITSFLYALELFRHKKISTYTYEYILSVSALLNIFIFTFIDISFFFLFAIEYLILFLSRTVKSSLLLFFFIVLFILPFLPVVYIILVYSEGQRVYNLIFCGLKENILLGFILVPFNLLWLRILARKKIKSHNTKATLFEYLSIGFYAISFLIVFSFATVFSMEKIFFRNVDPPPKKIKIKDALANEHSSVVIYDSDYYGGTVRRIDIECSKDLERCEVYVTGSDETPVYFSVFETSSVGHITQFMLPDNPPRKFSVQYTPNPSNSEIVVMNYFIQGVPDYGKKGAEEFCLRENFSFVLDNGKFVERRNLK